MRKLAIVTILLASTLDAAADSGEADVVGGTKVPAGKWRDVVAVLGAEGVCTGTLVAPDVVLTAGHCIDAKPYAIVADTIDYDRPGGDRIAVKSARAYPSWESKYDVGVLMLEHVARPKPRAIASACTARTGLVAGATVHAVGFGLTTKTGTDANTSLREAAMPVIDPSCTGDPGCTPAIAPSGEFTAGGGGIDSCFGDSGGPIFLDTPAGPVLIGVVSRGVSTADQPCGGGGIYERADKVAAWIKKVTGAALTRSACDDPADGDAEDGDDADTGGCSAGGGGGLGALVAIALLRRKRRR